MTVQVSAREEKWRVVPAVQMGALQTQVLENGKGKYETAYFARMENASTENASTMQTFSQIKKSLVFHKLVWSRTLGP